MVSGGPLHTTIYHLGTEVYALSPSCQAEKNGFFRQFSLKRGTTTDCIPRKLLPLEFAFTLTVLP